MANKEKELEQRQRTLRIATEFIDKVYEGLTGHAVLVTRNYDTGELTDTKWGTLPTDKATLCVYTSLRWDEDVYLATATFESESRSSTGAAYARAVYADADTCHPDNFRVPPSIIVETSPGRWHAWWLLDEVVPAIEAARVSHKIANAHKAQGCDAGWAANKLLRVPGTRNTKNGQNFDVTATYTDEVYTLDTLDDVYGDIKINEVAGLSPDAPVYNDEDVHRVEGLIESAGLTDFYTRMPPASADLSDWSARFQMDMFRAGVSPEDVYLAVRESSFNKYDPARFGEVTASGNTRPRRQDPDGDLWAEVQRLYSLYQFEGTSLPEEAAQKPAGAFFVQGDTEFLTPEEREWVAAHPSFIDTYTEWVASTNTDSAPVFQRSFAMFLLSCVYGDRAYLQYNAHTNLNLWFLVLAGSTNNRKSTAKNRALSILHEFEERVCKTILIANDATSEALTKALGERDGQVSAMVTDEVQGLFQEAGQKSYRSGFLATLSKIYDGEVEVALRITSGSGNTKRAKTVFNYAGVGIADHVSRTLTKENFESGFLPRFLFAVADPVPLTEDADDLSNEAVNVKAIAGRYAGSTKIVDSFVLGLRALPKEPFQIMFDDTALDRLNQWSRQLNRWVIRTDGAQELHPSVARFRVSVQKTAALLALHDRKTVISEGHLLHALAQAEYWFVDLVKMANAVSSSDFERKVDEIEKFIRAGKEGRRSVTYVRDRFKQYRVAEQDEFLNQLTQRGRIRKMSVDNVPTLEALNV